MFKFFVLLLALFSSLALAKSDESIHQIYNSRGNYQNDVSISIIHDDKRNVTCYLAQNGRGTEVSISCVKDEKR